MSRGIRVFVAAAVLASAFAISAVNASAATPTPRWIKHIRTYPGGISTGVRAMASPAAVAAQARHLQASGRVRAALDRTCR